MVVVLEQAAPFVARQLHHVETAHGEMLRWCIATKSGKKRKYLSSRYRGEQDGGFRIKPSCAFSLIVMLTGAAYVQTATDGDTIKR